MMNLPHSRYSGIRVTTVSMSAFTSSKKNPHAAEELESLPLMCHHMTWRPRYPQRLRTEVNKLTLTIFETTTASPLRIYLEYAAILDFQAMNKIFSVNQYFELANTGCHTDLLASQKVVSQFFKIVKESC